MRGPTTQTPSTALVYHLTVGFDGRLVKVQPVFHSAEGDEWGNPWTQLCDKTVADFAARCDFDRLVIHTPKEQNAMKFTYRQALIIEHMTGAPYVTVRELARAANAPVATVRRNIAALRNKGYNIENAVGGGYRLAGQLPEVSPAVTESEFVDQDEAEDIERGTFVDEEGIVDPEPDYDYDDWGDEDDPFDDGLDD